MRITIVTVYKSTNTGSFLQAYVLKKYLEQMYGCDVLHADTGVHTWRRYVFEKLRTKKFDELVFLIKAKWNYRKYFPLIKEVGWKKAKESEIFIYGSDVIWDVSREYGKNPIFWGMNVQNLKIAFATTVSDSNLEAVLENKDKALEVRNYKRVMVRDVHTKTCIENVSGVNCDIVCDPTFLWKRDEYEVYAKKYKEIRKGYILLYIVSNIDKKKEYVDKIKFLAKVKGLRIVSFGWYRRWAHENVAPEPWAFIRYFMDAEYIITDTFHGTCFSINFQKKFAVIQRNKMKVNCLLEQFDLTGRICKNQNDILRLYEDMYDVNYVGDKVEKLRTESIQMLDESIRGLCTINSN